MIMIAKSRSQERRLRAQIPCKHELAEKETALANGMCPLCMEQKIKELEIDLENLRGEYRAERQEYSKERKEQ